MFVLVVARETFDVTIFDPDRAVALSRPERLTAARDAVAARDVFVETLCDVDVRAFVVDELVRTFAVWVVEREITLVGLEARPVDTICFVPERDIVAASRTAASETPMPIKHAKITGNTFLILTTSVMLAKKNIFEQGVFNKKLIKNPVV